MAMYRHTIREQLFKLLFRLDFIPENEMKEQEELFFDSGDQTYSAEDRAEIEEKLSSILSHRGEIDRELSEKAEGWSLDRMGKAELAILRLAVYEIRYDDTVPERVAINEAVELARTFGQDNAPAFVNAVLSRFTAEGAEKYELKKAEEAAAPEEQPDREKSGGAEVHIVHSRQQEDKAVRARRSGSRREDETPHRDAGSGRTGRSNGHTGYGSGRTGRSDGHTGSGSGRTGRSNGPSGSGSGHTGRSNGHSGSGSSRTGRSYGHAGAGSSRSGGSYGQARSEGRYTRKEGEGSGTSAGAQRRSSAAGQKDSDTQES